MLQKYSIGQEIGRGGRGIVRVVRNAGGEEFACKTVRKTVGIDAIDHEIAVLKQLAGCSAVAGLHEVIEDRDSVNILTELCRGGQVGISSKERGSQYIRRCMKAILTSIEQCHARGVIHCDVKPSNFVFEITAPDSIAKAIDFGCSRYTDAVATVMVNQNQGTPWYLAPETFRSKWGEEADAWAVGVTAYQLLSGRMPFDDPSRELARVLNAILFKPLNMKRQCFYEDPDASDFVKQLLIRDPSERMSIKAALAHPFISRPAPDDGTLTTT